MKIYLSHTAGVYITSNKVNRDVPIYLKWSSGPISSLSFFLAALGNKNTIKHKLQIEDLKHTCKMF